MTADNITISRAALGKIVGALDQAKRWHQGDKWRDNSTIEERAAWEDHLITLDAALTEARAAMDAQGEVPPSYRTDFPTSASEIGAENKKAKADERLYGVGFSVNGWHVPAAKVACWGMSKAVHPQGSAVAWDEGYAAGVNDERISESNIGVAGFDAKVNPARENPYRRTHPQATEPAQSSNPSGEHSEPSLLGGETAPSTAGEREEESFSGYLCQAWGETELPCAEVVRDLAGVRKFQIREWLGSEDDRDGSGELTLPSIMEEIEAHDMDECNWQATFEIGGVSVTPVYSVAAALLQSTALPAPSVLGEPAPKANMFHDAGAIARCSYCGRYTLDRNALGGRQPVCTCGKQHGWSGSFKAPGPDAQWHGPAPLATPAALPDHSEQHLDMVAAMPVGELTDEQRKAAAICLSANKVSVSMVQRTLNIGYNAAQELCQSIIDAGLVPGVTISPSLTAARSQPVREPLTVRLCSYPESNGKRNWTAMFIRTKPWGGLIGSAGGITVAYGECWNRVAYEAERARVLIGERINEPDILQYGKDVATPEEWTGSDPEAAHGITKKGE